MGSDQIKILPHLKLTFALCPPLLPGVLQNHLQKVITYDMNISKGYHALRVIGMGMSSRVNSTLMLNLYAKHILRCVFSQNLRHNLHYLIHLIIRLHECEYWAIYFHILNKSKNHFDYLCKSHWNFVLSSNLF